MHALLLQLALLIKDKSSLNEEKLEAMKEIVGEEDKAKEIIEVRVGNAHWEARLAEGVWARGPRPG